MNLRKAANRLLPLLALMLLPRASACAACFGQSDSTQAQGMNAGILTLLAFVVLFWVAFGSFFVFIVRRGRQTGEPLPGDQNDPQHN